VFVFGTPHAARTRPIAGGISSTSRPDVPALKRKVLRSRTAGSPCCLSWRARLCFPSPAEASATSLGYCDRERSNAPPSDALPHSNEKGNVNLSTFSDHSRFPVQTRSVLQLLVLAAGSPRQVGARIAVPAAETRLHRIPLGLSRIRQTICSCSQRFHCTQG